MFQPVSLDRYVLLMLIRIHPHDSHHKASPDVHLHLQGAAEARRMAFWQNMPRSPDLNLFDLIVEVSSVVRPLPPNFCYQRHTVPGYPIFEHSRSIAEVPSIAISG